MARQMKDSGVEWIGEIPEEWKLKRLSSLFEDVNKKVSDKDFRPLSVTKQGILPQIEGVAKTDNGDNRKLVQKGNFVINSRSDRKGSSGVSEYEGSVSLINIVFRAKSEVSMQYMHHLLRSYGFQEEFYRWGHGIVADLWTTNSTDARNILLPYPKIEEQSLIAATLTSKCAEIDKVVEQTRATIEEYKKLKQAIITEAVTKGVRGPRPMKPSGVEWIGDIPEEWEVRKVSQFWKANKGPNAAQLTAEYCGNHPGAYPVYSGQTENNGVMGMIDTYSFDFGARGCLFSTTVGAKAMTVSCLYNKFSLSQNCMIMQPLSEKCDVRYYFYLFAFIFGYFRSLIPDYMQPSFRVKDFLSYCMLLPSVIEQQEIVTYLDTKCAEIDSIIEMKEQLIEELGSYKKSLIYEYVTGKKEVTA